ncbi:hypothetical protein B0H13DRAFT_870342 [Mycena leptocephala]|nr:hypothetical protein B0H13DRAFT_870342 [Mycena leptocephala]
MTSPPRCESGGTTGVPPPAAHHKCARAHRARADGAERISHRTQASRIARSGNAHEGGHNDVVLAPVARWRRIRACVHHPHPDPAPEPPSVINLSMASTTESSAAYIRRRRQGFRSLGMSGRWHRGRVGKAEGRGTDSSCSQAGACAYSPSNVISNPNLVPLW